MICSRVSLRSSRSTRRGSRTRNCCVRSPKVAPRAGRGARRGSWLEVLSVNAAASSRFLSPRRIEPASATRPILPLVSRRPCGGEGSHRRAPAASCRICNRRVPSNVCCARASSCEPSTARKERKSCSIGMRSRRPGGDWRPCSSESRDCLVTEVGAALGISRKYSMPLLDHLDTIRFTRRVKDRRLRA